MSKIVIKVENLSKQYRLGQVSTGTLAHDVNRWWHQIRGKEDPYLKVGEANDRTTTGTSEYVWALKDVGFELKQGEVLGIIGRNGAGKSTLLKILSRTTAPTTGSVKVKGRIASLLEVGTGFHPELSGRENIFLNGAILGMTKNEIKRKFDEIVDFAGVERYIETPVKRYSSGMYVRLAFAVAAHLEPEILIVDEVLAVGDAEFQKKCLGKMKDVSEKEGRTVLFVSHNIDAVSNLCTTGLYLKNGMLEYYGTVDDTIDRYIKGLAAGKSRSRTIAANELTAPRIIDYVVDNDCLLKGELKIRIEFASPFDLDEVNLGVVVKTMTGTPLFASNCKLDEPVMNEKNISRGFGEVSFKDVPVHTGTYIADIYLGDKSQDYDVANDALTFDLISYKNIINNYSKNTIGHTVTDAVWKISKQV